MKHGRPVMLQKGHCQGFFAAIAKWSGHVDAAFSTGLIPCSKAFEAFATPQHPAQNLVGLLPRVTARMSVSKLCL